MTLRWPFSKTQHKQWVGISLSSLAPSAVIYSHEGIVDSIAYNQEQGIKELELWLKKYVTPKTPAVLVLDESDYELLLVEAPNVPDEELTAALEYRIGDLLNQPIEETAIQAVRLPSDAYRGRMSMAYVVATPNSTIKDKVRWAAENNLDLEVITVPEFSLLNILSASSIKHGIALLELTPSYGTIRIYQDGALYLTRQVEVGLDALNIQNEMDLNSSDINNANSKIDDGEPLLIDEVSLDDETFEDAVSSDLELDENNLERDLDIDQDSYVGFLPKSKVNTEQAENLVLEVQRSLDYYESQLGMGQITKLWIMAGDVDLTSVVDAMQPVLTAKIEQPNVAEKIKSLTDINILNNEDNMNNSIMALGGALAYVAR